MSLKSNLFRNVKSKQTSKNELTITFDLTLRGINRTFHLFLKKEDGKWSPKEIHHGAFSGQENFSLGKCPVCHNFSYRCDFLTTHGDKVLSLVQDHPNIRLHLLF